MWPNSMMFGLPSVCNCPPHASLLPAASSCSKNCFRVSLQALTTPYASLSVYSEKTELHLSSGLPSSCEQSLLTQRLSQTMLRTCYSANSCLTNQNITGKWKLTCSIAFLTHFCAYLPAKRKVEIKGGRGGKGKTDWPPLRALFTLKANNVAWSSCFLMQFVE